MCTIVSERVTSCWMTHPSGRQVCAFGPPRAVGPVVSPANMVGRGPREHHIAAVHDRGVPDAEIVAAFGQTECSPITCLLHGDDAISKIGSVGTPMLTSRPASSTTP